MTTTTVYRIEHAEYGCGPYTGYDLHLDPDDQGKVWNAMARFRGRVKDRGDDDWIIHPPPDEDGILGFDSDEFCGFESLESMLTWFDLDFVDDVADIGYAVFAFEVSESFVRHGRRQVVFRRSLAHSRRPVSHLDLVCK